MIEDIAISVKTLIQKYILQLSKTIPVILTKHEFNWKQVKFAEMEANIYSTQKVQIAFLSEYIISHQWLFFVDDDESFIFSN